MLQFDKRGNLMPYGITELTLSEFEAFFVKGLEVVAHRQRLFDNYLLYLEELKQLIRVPFHQWIVGSFLSTKTQPNDFDMLSFFDFDTYHQKRIDLNWLKVKGRIDWKIDSNFAFTCEPNHPKFVECMTSYYSWLNLFGSTRKIGTDMQYPTGIITLNFK